MKIWESHGLKCKAGLSPSGVPVGYVGLPADHPDYKEPRDNIDVDVHGGLTYADYWYATEQEKFEEGKLEDKLWWVGFDCGHAWDMDRLGDPWDYPADGSFIIPNYRPNKDMSYVEQETERLAKQMAERYKK